MTDDIWQRFYFFMAGIWVSAIWAMGEDRTTWRKLLMACVTVTVWPLIQAAWFIDRAVFLYRLATKRKNFSS